MSCIATLIAQPGRAIIDSNVIGAALAFLPRSGAPRWLSEGEACDIPFASATIDKDALAMLAMEVRNAFGGAPVDIVCQPEAGRRKKLFLADMDSTMIGQECIDELADLVGMKEHVSAITERAMRGEIAFEPALRERVALLKGLDAHVVAKVIEERITLTPGGCALVRTMRAHGAYTALVSGGFTLFTSQIAEMIGFHEDRSNTLVIEDGKFAGVVSEPILGREAKLATLVELRDANALTAEQTMAVGDGANDLAMLQEAGLGVAFHAKPAVAAAAHARIDFGDLSALLYAQGYAKSVWVEN
ncbi:MAG: phosphoserine phosphatase SerB [Beijerinckiaceae bacterium]|nr:phosphoserine phosphatase SerB [Beijerinckiaceae bacterium]